MATVYQYDRNVILSNIPRVIQWLQSKADEAGSGTVPVSGLDCKVAADTVAGLLAIIAAPESDVPEPDEDEYWERRSDGGLHFHAYDPAIEDEDDEELTCEGCGKVLYLNGETLCSMCAEAGPLN